MTDHRSKWMQAMIKKHGSEEAVREFMRESGQQAKRSRKGGFHYLKQHDPEKFKQISAKGGKKSVRTTDTNDSL
jgi:general stress protein YciG